MPRQAPVKDRGQRLLEEQGQNYRHRGLRGKILHGEDDTRADIAHAHAESHGGRLGGFVTKSFGAAEAREITEKGLDEEENDKGEQNRPLPGKQLREAATLMATTRIRSSLANEPLTGARAVPRRPPVRSRSEIAAAVGRTIIRRSPIKRPLRSNCTAWPRKSQADKGTDRGLSRESMVDRGQGQGNLTPRHPGPDDGGDTDRDYRRQDEPNGKRGGRSQDQMAQHQRHQRHESMQENEDAQDWAGEANCGKDLAPTRYSTPW